MVANDFATHSCPPGSLPLDYYSECILHFSVNSIECQTCVSACDFLSWLLSERVEKVWWEQIRAVLLLEHRCESVFCQHLIHLNGCVRSTLAQISYISNSSVTTWYTIPNIAISRYARPNISATIWVLIRRA